MEADDIGILWSAIESAEDHLKSAREEVSNLVAALGLVVVSIELAEEELIMARKKLRNIERELDELKGIKESDD